MEAASTDRNVRRRWLALAALLPPALGLGIFLAGADDVVHLFEDQYGLQQVVVSTAAATRLPLALALGAAIVVGFWLACSLAASRLTDRPLREAAALDALTYMPLAVLLIVPLRWVPGIARSSAALFLLSSKMSCALLFVAILLVVALKVRFLRATDLQAEKNKRRGGRLSDRAVGWLVFATALAALAVAVPLFHAHNAFGGDQPHYLIVAHSIVEDGDIAIEDDHEAGAWRRFTVFPIQPQYLRRAWGDTIVPVHRIGLPLLAALPYALAGKTGALLLLSFLAALAAANLYWLVIKIVPDRRAALAAVAWAVLSVPALPMSFLFFTEIPQAALTLAALNLIFRDRGDPPRLPWLIPFVAWSLPWLHARGFVTAAVLSLALLLRLGRRRGLAAGLLLLCAVLALATPAWNWWLYGEFSLLAELGRAQASDVGITNVLANFGGLLFDQEFGLLLYNPALVVALVGCVALWRRSRSTLIWVIVVAASCVGPGLAYHMWWGGGSAPARYAAPVIHLAALPMAAFLADRSWRRWRPGALIACACAVAVASTLIFHPGLLVNIRDGSSHLLTAVSAGPFDAVEWWPSWIAGGRRFWPLVGLLLLSVAAAAGALAALNHLWRRLSSGEARGPGAHAAAVATGFALLVAFAALYGAAAETLTPGEPNGFQPLDREADLEYQRRYRHRRHLFVDQAGGLRPDSLPSRTFTAEFLYARETLSPDTVAARGRSLRLVPGGEGISLAPTTPFWAGRYRLRLALRGEGVCVPATVSVFDAAGAGGSTWEPSARAVIELTESFRDTVIPLALPNNSAGLLLRFESAEAVRFSYAALDALSLERLPRGRGGTELFDLAAWRFDDYLLLTGPEAIYQPEGDRFWTRGDSGGHWAVVSTERFAALEIELRGRPAVSLVLESDLCVEIVSFDRPGRSRRVELPVRPRHVGDRWIAELQVATRGAFVPASLREGSEDERRLGVFVRLTPRR